MPGRRQVLGWGGSLAAAGVLGVRPARATAAQRARTRVAVLGGGIGGLTAAHELAERGFDVTVYDRRAEWGGKARSLDPAVTQSAGGGLENDDTYFLNDVSSWELRCEAVTAIPNLFLAGDHVRAHSNVDFTTMECANETGRRAASAVLEAAGAHGADEVRLFGGAEPPGFAELKAADRIRYRLGLPHVLDL
ncbi:tRNA 5-methylaminomethyl-2-thiouridine biosynthesis bifunctional protein MnmC [Streptomyces jeddahensis]|uniref:tRNA 5-methylaminomethyl-2-thiouridine biosynthesis bifunctional protein MnmC n=2 Tax=Streptomyces jeddahensis TaxID=1716141 RepID=A0A177HV30_9ACTN|nr:tRNA 5-methylaminomethyl-2-thiouridine biosynthesis bifunctional protein MnmC [Streptomyces jeddahensis]